MEFRYVSSQTRPTIVWYDFLARALAPFCHPDKYEIQSLFDRTVYPFPPPSVNSEKKAFVLE
jgi:hypothetical protein